jgi:hypothetical protein
MGGELHGIARASQGFATALTLRTPGQGGETNEENCQGVLFHPGAHVKELCRAKGVKNLDDG